MCYEIFYRIGNMEDSIVIEGESFDEIRKQAIRELEKRNAEYRYSIWLNN